MSDLEIYVQQVTYLQNLRLTLINEGNIAQYVIDHIDRQIAYLNNKIESIKAKTQTPTPTEMNID